MISAAAQTAAERAHALLPARRITENLLVAGVFFAPYLAWRPFHDIMLTLSDVLFVLAAMLIVATGSGVRRPLGAFTPMLLIAFLVMMLALLTGSLAFGRPLRWAIVALQYTFALVVLPFLLIGHGPSATRRLAKALVVAMVAMESVGIGLYLAGFSYDDNELLGHDFITGAGRLGAWLSDANWNGAMIAMTLPLIAYLRHARIIGRWPAGVAATVLLLGLLLASSVSAMACMVAATAVLVVIGRLRVPLSALAILALVVASYAALGGSLPRAFATRVLPAVSTGELAAAGTFEGRYELIEEAWNIVGDTMVIGIGVDQYREISAHGAPVHNMYLLMWSEGGLAALFAWVVILVLLACAASQAWSIDRMICGVACSQVTTLIIASTASPHMYNRLWLVPIFVSMALVYEAVTGRSGEGS